MKKIHLILPMLAAVLWSACGSSSTETPKGPLKFDLSVRMPKGHTHTFVQTHTEVMNMGEAGGGAAPAVMTMTMRETVTDVDAQGTITIESVYDNFSGTMPSMDGKMVSFNTNAPNPDPSVQMFYAMVGQKMSYKVSKGGVISQMTYSLDSMTKGMFSDPNYGMRDQLEEVLNTYNFSQETPLDSGATWTTKGGTRAAYPLWYENTWKLTGGDSTVCHVSLESKVSPHPQALGDAMMGTMTDWKLSGTRSGILDVDTKTGNARKAEISTKLTGTMITKADGKKIKTDMETPVTLEITDTFEITW